MKSVLFAGLAFLTLIGCTATPEAQTGTAQLVDYNGEPCPSDAQRQTPPRSAMLALDRDSALPVAWGCRTKADWATIAEIKRDYDRCLAEATAPGGRSEQSCRYRRVFF